MPTKKNSASASFTSLQMLIALIGIVLGGVIGACGNKVVSILDKQAITQDQAKELVANQPMVTEQKSISDNVSKMNIHLEKMDDRLTSIEQNYAALNQKVEDQAGEIKNDIKELKETVKDADQKH